MVVLLAGHKKNIGDFLIVDRARQLFEEFVDKDIVILDRFQNLEPHLETINKARYVVLCGGPAYAPEVYDKVYPLVDDLSKIKVPILPFGLGWCGAPAQHPEKFKFSDKALNFLKDAHSKIDSSSCRDVETYGILKNSGLENVTMTGCPVWYHLPSIGKKFKTGSPKKIVITTPASQKLVGQTLKIVKMTKKYFPDAELYLSYHRGILPGNGTGYRKSWAYIRMAIGSKFIKPGIKIRNVAYDLKRLDFYDGCDFHIGYRVHAHLYFFSKRLPSLLINEDGRGVGMTRSLEQPELNIWDPELLKKTDELLSKYKENGLSDFEKMGTVLDKKFETMKEFLQNL